VQSLHAIPGLIAAILGAIFAALASENDESLFKYYPARETKDDIAGRSAFEQAGYQLIALVITIGIALVAGALTGLVLRVPIFVQLSQDIEMFDDEAQWITPDDYALKLTFATQPQQQQQQQSQQEQSPESEKKEDTNV
jgi:ammonium transporter Rh